MTGACDFVVVGAGSAGCCLANRLSADPQNRVVLLEAGGKDTNPMIKVPIGFTRLMYDPRTTSLYETEPEAHLDGRKVSVMRGRVLGGCSSINGMIYMRGQREDYDDWAALPGCRGWSYDELLPYFLRSERFDGPAGPYHGRDGELHVTSPRGDYPISRAYVEAAVAAGIPHNDDLNGARQEGIGTVHVNQHAGARWSAADAFLSAQVKKRPNLRIVTNARVLSVDLDGRRAIGVTYLDASGKERRLRAGAEVVVSAGAYDSAPLLERSGIGNPDVLAALGVPVRHALPGVGENLQDHFQLWIQQGVKTRATLGEDGKFPRVLWSVLRYVATKRGPLSFPAATIGGFVRSAQGGRPIFQIHFTPGAGSMDESGNMVASAESGVNATVTVVRPTSRGSVHARDAKPTSPPRIVHDYLSTDHDRRLAVEGFRLLRAIYAAAPFREHATHELVPGPDVQTDDEILAFWRSAGMSVYHPVGSAKMGAADDPGAVVDEALRVHGIGGLRVVDASIFPLLPSGNTHAPVVAVAERASELLLASR